MQSRPWGEASLHVRRVRVWRVIGLDPTGVGGRVGNGWPFGTGRPRSPLEGTLSTDVSATGHGWAAARWRASSNPLYEQRRTVKAPPRQRLVGRRRYRGSFVNGFLDRRRSAKPVLSSCSKARRSTGARATARTGVPHARLDRVPQFARSTLP